MDVPRRPKPRRGGKRAAASSRTPHLFMLCIALPTVGGRCHPSYSAAFRGALPNASIQ